MTINLPLKLQRELEKRAHEQGTTPDLLVIDSLERMYLASPVSSPQEQNLADYWADYIGSVDTSEIVPGGASLSCDTGDKFSDLMLEKHRKSE